MNELINVTLDDNHEPVVSGRQLHKALEVKTEYKKWFSRMTEYGFNENEDFLKVTQKCLTSSTGQNTTDHYTLTTSPIVRMSLCSFYLLYFKQFLVVLFEIVAKSK